MQTKPIEKKFQLNNKSALGLIIFNCSVTNIILIYGS